MKAIVLYLIILFLYLPELNSQDLGRDTSYYQDYPADAAVEDSSPSSLNRGIWDFQKYFKLELAGAGKIYLNTIFGSLTHIREDIRYSELQFPHEIRFTYNSGSSFSGRYGKGWTMNFNIRYYENVKNQHVIIADADDKTELFKYQEKSSYIGMNGVRDSLVKLQQGYKLIRWKDNENNRGDYSEYYFDSPRHPYATKILNRNGSGISLSYNFEGSLASVSYPSGLLFSFIYENDKLIRIQNGETIIAVYYYNGDFLEKVEYPDGTFISYEYELECGKLFSITNQAGGAIQFVYNSDLTINKVIYPHDTTNYFIEYNLEERSSRIIAPKNISLSFTYDSLYRTTSMITPVKKTTYFNWDSYNLSSLKTSEQEIRYKYDFRHNIIEINKNNKVSTYNWDYKFNKLKSINSLELDAFANMDSSGNIVKIEDDYGKYLFAYNKGLTSSFFKNQVDKYNYRRDDKGKLITISGKKDIQIEYDNNFNISTIVVAGVKHNFIYDTRNRLVKYKNPFGGNRLFEYNVLGNIKNIRYENGAVESFQNDLYGRLIRHINRTGDTTFYKYDNLSNIEEIYDKEGLEFYIKYNQQNFISEIIDVAGYSMSFAYGGLGEVLSFKSKLNKITEYKYNDINLLSQVILPDGNQLNFQYNNKGKISSKIFGDGSTVTYSYTKSGKTNTINYKNSYVYQFNYDNNDVLDYFKINDKEYFLHNQNGLPVKLIDHKNHIYQLSYASDGSLREIVNPFGLKYRLSYKNGEVSSIENPLNQLQKFEFDSVGNIIRFNYLNDILFDYDNYSRISTIRYPNNSFKWYQYDYRGRIIEFNDRENHKYILKYNKNNHIKSIIFPDKSYYEYHYDLEDNLIFANNSVEDRVVVNYLNNNLINIISPLNSASFTYDRSGNISVIRSSSGAQANFIWDAINRINSISAPESGSYSFRYKDNDVVSIQDPYQRKTSIFRGIHGPEKVIYPDGDSVVYTYFNNGQIHFIKEVNGLVIEKQYDQLQRLTKIKSSLAEINYSYDLLNNIVQKQNENGGIFKYQYDNMNNLIKIQAPPYNYLDISYNKENKPILLTDPSGLSYRIIYDSLNQILEIKNKLLFSYARRFDILQNVTEIYEPKGPPISLNYDAIGRIIYMRDRNNGLFTYKYDPNGNMTSIAYPQGNEVNMIYDKADRLTSIKLLPNETISFSYNKNGKLVTRTDPKLQSYIFKRNLRDSVIKIIDPLENEVNILYDKGRITGLYDQHNSFFSIRRDINGRITEKVNPDNERLQYIYNLSGALIKSWDLFDTTAYTKDDSGLILSIARGIDRYDYNYDYLGNLLSLGRGDILKIYLYDFSSNIIQTSSGNKTIKYSYDNCNNLVSAISGSDEIILEYNNNNSLINFNQSYISGSILRNKNNHLIGIKKGNLEWLLERDGLSRIKNWSNTYSQYSFSYDVASNLLTIETPNDSIIRHVYNSNFLINITGLPSFASYSYFKNMMLKSSYFKNEASVTEDFIYDKSLRMKTYKTITDDLYYSHAVEHDYRLQLPISQKHTLPGKTLVEYNNSKIIKFGRNGSLNIKYDSSGRILSLMYPNGIIENRTYTPAGEILSAIIKNKFDSTLFHYNIDYGHNQIEVLGADTLKATFDFLGRLETIDKPGKNRNIEYSNSGDRIADIINSKTTNYTIADNKLIQAGGIEFEYDKAGNVIRKIDSLKSTRYVYDNLNRLIKVYNHNGKEALFDYSATGQLYRITTQGVTFITDSYHPANTVSDENSGVMFEVNNDRAFRENYYFYDSTLNMRNFFAIVESDSELELFAHYDYLGRLRFYSDKDGNVIPCENIGEFGECNKESSFRFQYKGMMYDSISGLYFDGSRFYDPDLGRYINLNMSFVSEDMNPYIFSNNNPFRYIFKLKKKYDVPQYELWSHYEMDYHQPFLLDPIKMNTFNIFTSYLNYFNIKLFKNFENFGIILEPVFKKKELFTESIEIIPKDIKIFNIKKTSSGSILPDYISESSIKETNINIFPALPEEMEVEFDFINNNHIYDPFQILKEYKQAYEFDIRRRAPINISGLVKPKLNEIIKPDDYFVEPETGFNPEVEVGGEYLLPELPIGELSLYKKQEVRYRNERSSDISLNELILYKENAINQNISKLLDLKKIIYTSNDLDDGYLNSIFNLIIPIEEVNQLNYINRLKVNKQFLLPDIENEMPGISLYEEEDPLIEFAKRRRPELLNYFIEKKLKNIEPDGRIFDPKKKQNVRD